MITQQQLNELNNKIPKNYLWDGFWIDSFKKNVLNISASFDKMYYRDFMIIYKGVSFFNLPLDWRDTDVHEEFMYLADVKDFAQKFPNEAIDNKTIIEWKFSNLYGPTIIESYYIVCSKIFVFKCNDAERNYDMSYKEPLSNKEFIEKKFCNRVPMLKV